MNSAVSPGTMSKRPAFQSALAASMRSLREETKFHQMWRGPSIGGAADHDDMRVADSLDVDAVAGLEHQEPFRPVAVAGDLDLAGNDVERAFLVVGVERQDSAGLQMRFGENRVPAGRDRRAQAVHRPGDDAQCQAVLAQSGISAAAVWAKAGAVSSSFIGSATHNCRPCSGSPPSR